MAKRSPILGYNHNVKYRGIVFHVQTEDSGLGSPHLFTHLFHEGVIISTRKLVYDPGANEEAIKALMQAQHKAVMKDLMKGSYPDPGVAQVRKLLRLRAIGVNSAWLYVREVFAWRRIHNRRELAALVGLVPTPYQSGDEEREQGISKAGNRRMRAMAVEIAWCWLQFQPESALSRWYLRRFAHGGRRQRRIGIVALARKVLVAIWKYLESDIVPEGAQLTNWRGKGHYTAQLA